jgi:hypothetical protein
MEAAKSLRSVSRIVSEQIQALFRQCLPAQIDVQTLRIQDPPTNL